MAPPHLLLPTLAGQNSYNFPFATTLQDHSCTMRSEPAGKSPSLGPMTVLGRQTGHRAKQHRTGSKAECHANFVSTQVYPCPHNPCPHSGRAMPIVPGPSVEATVHRYLECASCFSKVLLSAPTNVPPLSKQNIPFALTMCANLVVRNFEIF